jgi:hypothetical protein
MKAVSTYEISVTVCQAAMLSIPEFVFTIVTPRT